MDPIFIAFLTVALNALVTFFLLKRHEARLARENTEHQTRFVQNYAKRVETLDTAYKKYIIFVDEASKLLSKTKTFYKSPKRTVQQLEPEVIEGYRSKLKECRTYFRDKGHYFPSDMTAKIEDVFVKSNTLLSVLFLVTLIEIDSEKVPNIGVINAINADKVPFAGKR